MCNVQVHRARLSAHRFGPADAFTTDCIRHLLDCPCLSLNHHINQDTAFDPNRCL